MPATVSVLNLLVLAQGSRINWRGSLVRKKSGWHWYKHWIRHVTRLDYHAVNTVQEFVLINMPCVNMREMHDSNRAGTPLTLPGAWLSRRTKGNENLHEGCTESDLRGT